MSGRVQEGEERGKGRGESYAMTAHASTLKRRYLADKNTPSDANNLLWLEFRC